MYLLHTQKRNVIFLVIMLLVPIVCHYKHTISMQRTHYGPHISQLANSSSEICHYDDAIPGSWQAAAGSGSQLPFTKQVQSAIWEHQHPDNCYNSSFLVYSAAPHLGIGAKLDHLAGALGRALDLGRVLLIDFHDKWLEGQYCDGFPTLDTCFFEPVSSCNLSHVYGQQFASNPHYYRNFIGLNLMREALSYSQVFLFEH